MLVIWSVSILYLKVCSASNYEEKSINASQIIDYISARDSVVTLSSDQTFTVYYDNSICKNGKNIFFITRNRYEITLVSIIEWKKFYFLLSLNASYKIFLSLCSFFFQLWNLSRSKLKFFCSNVQKRIRQSGLDKQKISFCTIQA